MTSVGVMASAVVIAPSTPPAIATTNTEVGTSLGTSNAIPLPVGIVAGDLLVAFIANVVPATATTFSGTWTQVANNLVTSAVRLIVAARIADGTANDNLAVTAAATADYCALTMRITGHGVTNVATDIKQATVAPAASTSANPPSLDAGSTKAWLWLAAATFATIGTGNDFTAIPANYTLVATIESANAANACDLSVTQRGLSAQTEDPATFSLTGSYSWVAATIAIPPP